MNNDMPIQLCWTLFMTFPTWHQNDDVSIFEILGPWGVIRRMRNKMQQFMI